jgi:chemotaxis response regulator CheB
MDEAASLYTVNKLRVETARATGASHGSPALDAPESPTLQPAKWETVFTTPAETHLGSDGSRLVRVLIVDDSELARSVLAGVVAATDGFAVAGTSASGVEALQALPSLDPDLVLLDVQMPVLSGPETARRIAETHPQTSVVFVSADPAFAGLVGGAPFLRKIEVAPDKLREVWDAIRADAAVSRSEARKLRHQSGELVEDAGALRAQAEHQAKRSKRIRKSRE